MHRLMVGLFLALAACTPREIADNGVYRAITSPIYSNATFDMRRLEGTWDQVAAFATSPQSECRAGAAEFGGLPAAVDVRYRLCLSGQELRGNGSIAKTGPGRFAINGKDGIGQDWWVLWVDESYRTMAIGNPSGTFGFILNRGRSLPADRLKAATEVFDFNGYDTEKMIVFRE
jgi:apolipoprotein D and lipocalin family protein